MTARAGLLGLAALLPLFVAGFGAAIAADSDHWLPRAALACGPGAVLGAQREDSSGCVEEGGADADLLARLQFHHTGESAAGPGAVPSRVGCGAALASATSICIMRLTERPDRRNTPEPRSALSTLVVGHRPNVAAGQTNALTGSTPAR